MKSKANNPRTLLVIASSLMAISSASAQVNGNWNTNLTGNWSNAARWSSNPSIPGGAGSIIGINSNITVNNLAVTIDTTSRTIGSLTIGDSNNSHSFLLNASGGASLIFDNNGSGATLTETGSISDTISAPITLADSLLVNPAGSLVLSGDISQTGVARSLTKSGAGTLFLSGTNGYAGTTTILRGTLNLGNSTATGSLASTALVLSGGTLSYTRTDSATQTFSTTAVNSGASAVSATAGNTLALGDITRSSGGTLTVGSTGAITTSDVNDVTTGILGPWAFHGSGATTRYATVSSGTIVGLTGTAAATAEDVTSIDGTVNYDVAAVGTIGTGANINTLRYTGAAGTIAGDLTANGVMNASGNLLTLSGAITSGTGEMVTNAANGGITFSTTLNNSGNLLTVDGSGATIITGAVSGSGSLTKIGTGTLTLSSSASSYAGQLTVQSGALSIASINNASSNGTLGNSALAVILGGNGNTGTLSYTGANASTTKNFTLATGGTGVFDVTTGLTLSGSITGSGNLTKTGAGGLTLSGSNNYTGTTTAFGTSFAPSGSNTQTIGNIVTTQQGSDSFITFDATSTGNTAGDFTHTGTNVNGTRTTIFKTGAGTWTLGNMTGFGGLRTILNPRDGILSVGQIVSNVDLRMYSAATLQLRTAGNQAVGALNSIASSLGGLTGTFDNSSGGLITFNLNPAIAFNGSFTLNGSSLNMGTGTVDLRANRQVTVSNAASTLTLGGIISGSGIGLTKLGAGTMALSNANTYTGATSISAGTLAITGATQATTAITFTGGSLGLDTGVSVTAASAAVNLANGTITITGTTGAASYTLLTAASITGTPVLAAPVSGYELQVIDGATDELRLVQSAPTGSLDHFAISAIGAPQTVGTPITGITITAQDAANQTVTSFTGTVNFSGTGGFSGTSASFTAGVLTGVSVTPTFSGSNMTLVVTDGVSGKTGSQTITTIQTQYAAWSLGAPFDGDANGDGVKNGLAFLLGASGPNVDALDKLPVPEEVSGGLRLTFQMLPAIARGTATLSLEHGNTLANGSWTTLAVPSADETVGDVVFAITGTNPLNVIATIPASKAADGKLFGRVKGVTP